MNFSLDLNRMPKKWFVFDEPLPDQIISDKLTAFAIADTFTQFIGKDKNHGLLHFWQPQNLLTLGMMDTKLPYFEEAIIALEEENQPFVVRNAGGLAVIADDGVLNFSLIVPDLWEEKSLSIDTAYEWMTALIQAAFSDFPQEILAYEIEDSYCPGTFDLSINGRKFAGIAQRRMKGGVAVMIYLSVNGNQQERAEKVKRFYENGLKGETTKWSFPDVHPAVMASLDELLGVDLTISAVKARILKVLDEQQISLETGLFTAQMTGDYQLAYQKMIKRNEQMLGAHFNKEL